MNRIRSFPLATFTTGVWRLGQAGIAIRLRNGPTVVVDPYLTDSAAKLSPFFSRKTPPPFPPSGLMADVVLITHTHIDHLDPATIGESPVRQHARFLGPPSACAELEKLGVRPDRLTEVEPGETWEADGLSIQAVPAFHSPDVPDAVGFRVRAGATGPLIHVTGDTLYDDRLADGRTADVLVAPINGKLGNMGPEGAARLAKAVNPRWAIPVHYDLMAANGEDPAAFAFHMERAGLPGRAAILNGMWPLLLDGSGGVPVTRQLAMSWKCGLPIRDVALPDGYRLRNFRDSDLPAIAEIYRTTFGHPDTWYARRFATHRLFKPERAFVVEFGGRAVATALAWEEGEEVGLKRGLLHFVATHPEHHQRGLGKAVTAAVMHYFTKDGREEVILTTDEHRLRAIRAYRALGFEPVVDAPDLRRRWENLTTALDQGAQE
jgi:L-ascorbate metabolism protein UlaG (beta-lactamase superfamily)/ribosomal protein S18 acetylase RimI-like enzyme